MKVVCARRTFVLLEEFMTHKVIYFLTVFSFLFVDVSLFAQEEEQEAETEVIDYDQMFNRAARRAARNDIGGAIELLEEIVESDPYWADIYFNIGLLAARIDRYDLCILSSRRFLFLEPEAMRRDDVLERIEECQEDIEEKGFLEIPNTTPEGLEISVDGYLLSEGSLSTLGLSVGPHTIVATQNEFDPYEEVITLVNAETLVHPIILTAIIYSGEIEFLIEEEGAVVFVDGVEFGTTPITENFSAPEGRYLVEVRLEGYHPWQRYYQIDRAAPAEVEVMLLSEDVDLSDL